MGRVDPGSEARVEEMLAALAVGGGLGSGTVALTNAEPAARPARTRRASGPARTRAERRNGGVCAATSGRRWREIAAASPV
jgi:hypothetical protein